jgi:hypothetical protein
MYDLDGHDVSEEAVRFVAVFTAWLRYRKQTAAQRAVQEADKPTSPALFAVWPLGVKGALSRGHIYDFL